MTIVAALLSISVGCYMFGVLYSPWGKDYRTEKRVAPAPPADEVCGLVMVQTGTVDVQTSYVSLRLAAWSVLTYCSLSFKASSVQRRASADAVGSLCACCL